MSHNEDKSRIAKNTIFLYIRTFLVMAVGLYTSRVTLYALGVDDFGIYNLVGGLVAMLSSVVGSLNVSIQRYMNIALGHNDNKHVIEVFSTSMNIFILMSGITVILGEFVGVWFVNNILNIPAERLYAANWVLQISLLTFVISLISVPYNALIVAHEKMKAFAYISILDVAFKLGIAFCISYITYDRLIIYAILLMLASLAIRSVYNIYCLKHFEESKYRWLLNKHLMKEMTSFASWNFLGATSAVWVGQGFNFVLNVFFGVTLNAARGIAFQVESQIRSFVTNFTTALQPQIMKSYAANDVGYFNTLVFSGAKLCFFLLMFLSLPVMLETPKILSLWLVEVPEYTVIFIRISLLTALVNSLSNTLIIGMQASGKIKKYQIVTSTVDLSNILWTYLAFKLFAAPAESLYWVYFTITLLQLFIRVYLLKDMINLNVNKFLSDVILRTIITFIIVFIMSYYIINLMESSIGRVLLSCFITTILSASIIYVIGINSNQRHYIAKKTGTLINRYIIKKI